MSRQDETIGSAARAEPFDAVGFAARHSAVIFLVALVVVFALLEPRFLSAFNLMNVLRQVSISGLIAIGMTFVILTAGIDLSVGALVALSGLVGAYVAKGGLEDRFAVGASVDAGNPVILAFLAAAAVGMAGGALQGWAVTRLRVPPFVVTLGGLTAFRGAALLFSGGGPISGFSPAYTWWGQGRIATVPIPVVIFAVTALIAHIVLRHTRFGLHVYAVGANPRAAEENGVPVRRVTWLVYVIVGFACGLATFLLSARLNSAEAVAGLGLELDVIAAVVIGGTSLFGGRGAIFGTLIGAITVGVFRSGLKLAGVEVLWQEFTVGVLIIVAVAMDQWIRKVSS